MRAVGSGQREKLGGKDADNEGLAEKTKKRLQKRDVSVSLRVEKEKRSMVMRGNR